MYKCYSFFTHVCVWALVDVSNVACMCIGRFIQSTRWSQGSHWRTVSFSQSVRWKSRLHCWWVSWAWVT